MFRLSAFFRQLPKREKERLDLERLRRHIKTIFDKFMNQRKKAVSFKDGKKEGMGPKKATDPHFSGKNFSLKNIL